jgi:hypothetical protein
MKFLLGIKVSENVSKGTFTNKEPKTIVITCSMPQQKVEITFISIAHETYRVNKRRKDILT